MAVLAPAPAPALVDVAWAELWFRAMGTAVHLSVLGDDPSVLVDARRRIDDLEARWTRFRSDSVLAELNASPGRPVAVDEETFTLVALAVHAWRETGGRFDPTVLDAVRAEGYDRSFDHLDPSGATGRSGPVPGCAGIHLDPLYDQIMLPEGVRLDLGGIGKGRAADLVAKDLVRAGVRSAVVNLGGDLRIAGPPLDEPLVVAIEDPLSLHGVAEVVAVRSGALATSSRARRAWTVDGEERHHLIDPTTGRSARSGLAAVTVLAADAVRAEVLAKAAFVAGADEGASLLDAAGTPGLLIDDDGRHRFVSGFEDHRP